MMKILKNSTFKNVETEKIVKEQVSSIIEDIKINKDEALKKYNLKFDNNDRNIIRVSKEEIEEAYKEVDDEFINNIKIAAKILKSLQNYKRKVLIMILKRKYIQALY